MARAALYFYQRPSGCAVCGLATDRLVGYRSSCDELGEGVVDVPLHRSCRLKAWATSAGLSLLVGASALVASTCLELMLQPAVSSLAQIPSWLRALNLAIACLAATMRLARGYSRLRARIDKEIRLNTVPID